MQKAIDLVKKATEADNDQKYEEALHLYEHAIDYFLHALKCKRLSVTGRWVCDSGYNDIVQTDEMDCRKSRETVRSKVARYLERAEELKKYLKKKTRNTVTEGGGSSAKSKKKR